jgi:hypothetical protein
MDEKTRRAREDEIRDALLMILLNVEYRNRSAMYRGLLVQDLLKREFKKTFLSLAADWPSPRTASKLADIAADARLDKVMPGILATIERADGADENASEDESSEGSPLLTTDPEMYGQLVGASETTAALAAAAIAEHGTSNLIWQCMEDACPICSPLGGTGFSVWGEQFPEGCPAHSSCRCNLIPVGGDA